MLDDAVLETAWNDAAHALLDRDFDKAADIFKEAGQLNDAADARLRSAEKLVRQGRRAEADSQFREALAFYRSVGATRYVREAESLLAASA
jgi:uncharacterized protein HemY